MTENFPLPTSYKYGKVIGRIIHAVADTPEDPDALPQARPASGKVVFTPAERIRKVVDADYPAIAMHEIFESTLSSSGRITDSEGRVGIWLIEGAWRVDFILDAGSIESFDILVNDSHTDVAPLDIISAVPYTPPTGVIVTTMLIPSGGQPGQTLTPVSSGSNTLEWIDTTVQDLSNFVTNDDSRLSDARTPTAHDHDDRYYTEAEVDTLISGIDSGGGGVGGGVSLSQINAAIEAHRVADEPHPAYDVEVPSLTLLFENGLI